MALSSCALLLLTVFTIAASFGIGLLGQFLYSKCAHLFKLPDYSSRAALVSGSLAMLLIAITIGVNTKEWKPCGKDSIAQALQKTPAQPVVASLAHNCGCCGNDK